MKVHALCGAWTVLAYLLTRCLVDDIISSPVVKESIINNSDCKILLDQRKYMNKFDQVQALLGLTEKEKSQILSCLLYTSRCV